MTVSQLTPPTFRLNVVSAPRAGRAAALVSGASLLALSVAWSPGAFAASSAALPTGGHFVRGGGTIGTSGHNLSVNQTTTRGIINWQSFSIGRGDKVTINNGSGATLNRVTGNDPSQIAGRLTSTGSVYVVNTAGVIVMPTGQVFTSGSFVASTRDEANKSFMAGGAQSFQGVSTAAVTNEGQIASANGNVTLIGSSVSNSGKITAANGTVAMAAGDKVMLQDSANETVVVDTGTGDATNSGAINAAQVKLAAADGNVYALAMNNGGVIRATGTKTENGRVVLTSEGGDTTVEGTVSAVNADRSGGRITITAGADSGKLSVTGTVKANAAGAAKSGGKIILTASAVSASHGADIQATGTANGGDVFIGGDRHGGRIASQNLSKAPISDAQTTTIARGVTISADGGRGGAGNGGNVVVWSNSDTSYYGHILVRGGTSKGNGGFVEVSGEGLTYHGHVTTAGRHGKFGTLLIDPSDVTIFNLNDTSGTVPGGTTGAGSAPIYDPTTGTSFILNTDIDNALRTNNVVINTGSTTDGLPGAGNIHFGTNSGSASGSNSAPIYWNANTTLTLNAIGVIDTIGGNPGSDTNVSGATASGASAAALAGILIDAAGGGSIVLNAGLDPTHNPTPITGTAITISANIQATTGTITLSSATPGTLIQDSGTIETTTGLITLQADEVRLGAGHTYIGNVITNGNVLITPATAGAVLIGNNNNGGGSAAQPDDDTANTALINNDSIARIQAKTLVLGGTNVTDLTIGSPAGIDTTQNNYVGINAGQVANLEFLTGTTGSVTQDARTPIFVGDGTGGLAIVTGGNIFMPDFNNGFGKLAIDQTGGAGTLVAIQTSSPAGDNTGTLTIGTVSGLTGAGVAGNISGIDAPNSTVTIMNVGTTTQDTSSAANAVVANNLVLEGGAAGPYDTSLTLTDATFETYTGPFTGAYSLNNTSNSITRVAGSVSSLSLTNNGALIVATLSDHLNTATAATGNGNPMAATSFAGIVGTGNIAITANGKFTIASGAPISTTGGNVTIEAGSPDQGAVAANTGFVNNDATGISVTGGGFWRIYSQDPRNDSYGALAGTVGSPNYAFVQYGAANSYGDPSAAGSGTLLSPSPFANADSVLAGNYTGNGNGFLYTVKPTVSESLTRAFNKIYDATTGVVPTLSGTDYSTVSGTINGDVVVLSHPTSANYDTKDVGTSKTVTTSGITAVSETDSLGVTVFGYTVTTSATGTGKITPKALTFSGLGASNKIYDATTIAQLTGTAALLGSEAVGAGTSGDGKWYAGDGIGLSAGSATGAFSQKDVANHLSVTVSGVSLTGNGLGDYTLTPLVGLTANITPKALTFSGLTAANKIYDATTVAQLTGTAALLGSEAVGAGTSGDGKWYAGDGIGLSAGSATGTFSQKDVANHLSVTVSGVSLTGNGLGDYTLTPLVGLTANITPKALTITGLTAANKIYDATTVAQLTGTAALLGSEAVGAGTSGDGKWYAGDGIGLSAGSATGTFSQKDVGNNIGVTVSGVSLTGNGLGDYTLNVLTSVTANITPKALTFSGLSASNKIYDATTIAQLTGTAALLGSEAVGAGTSGDGKWYVGDGIGLSAGSATGTFSQKDVGNSLGVTVSGVSLTGNGLGDYTLTPLVGLTANITPKALTFSGLSASNKIYDATTIAQLTGTAALLGSEAVGAGTSSDGKWYAGDGIGLSAGSATGTFSQKDVGNSLGVTVSGVSLTGNGLGDYTLTPLVGLTANITPKALTITGLTAANKIYDATTVAQLTGTAALLGSEAVGAGTSGDGKWYAGDGIGLSAGSATGTFSQKDVGNNIGVTVSGVSLTGNGLGDYTLNVLTSVTANITPKALTFSGLSASNKIYDATTVAQLTGTAALLGSEAVGAGTSSDGKWYAGDGIGLSAGSATGTFSQKDVGNNIGVTVSGVSLTANGLGDYTLTPLVGLTANITPKALTFSGLSASNKIYDATTIAQLTGTAALLGSEAVGAGTSGDGKWYAGDGIGLSAGSATGAFSQKDVANHLSVTVSGVSLTGNGLGDYTLTPLTSLTANITPKALSFSGLTANNKIYDATTLAQLTGTAALLGSEAMGAGTSGDGKWYAGDGIGLSAGSATGTFSQKDVANHLGVTVSGVSLTGNGLGDYTLTPLVGLTANITPKALSFDGLAAQSKVYDGNAVAALIGTAALLGSEAAGAGTSGDGKWYAGDGIGLTGTAGGTFSQKDVGNHLSVSVSGISLTGNTKGDYTLTPLTTLTANITPKALTVTGEKVYDGNTGFSTGELDITGGIAGETVTLTGGTGTSSSPNVAVYNTGTLGGLTIHVTGGLASNYKLPGHGKLVITPKTLNITADDETKTYGDTYSWNGTEFTVSGLVTGTGDSVTAASFNSLGAPSTANVGNYNINVSNAHGHGLGNYTLVYHTGTLTIDPRSIGVSIIVKGTRVYDGTPDADGSILTITNLANGDHVGLAGTGIATSSDVGTWRLKTSGGKLVGLTLTGADKNNYTTQGGKGTLTITPLPVVLTGTRVYDGGTDGNGSILSVTNAIGGDTVNVSGGTSTVSSKHVGDRTIVDFGTLTLGNNSKGDYTLVGAKGDVVITPLPVVLLGTRLYDGGTDGDGGILGVTNAIGGDTVDISGGTSTISTKNVGHDPIVDFGTLTLGNNPNGDYTLVGAKGTVIVTPLPVTVTGSREFDGNKDADGDILTVANGVLPGDGVDVAGGTGTLILPGPGNEAIVDIGTLTLGGADARNYYIKSGVVRITQNVTPPPFVPPPENPTASNTAYDNGIEQLQPKQNGIVTGTIATNDGEVEGPDTQLGCTLGDTGCLQNGVGTDSSQKPAN